MKISIIGAGNIGGTLAKLLVKAGHEVALANSRGPESLQKFTNGLGSKAKPVTITDAVAYSDIIIFSIPWRNIANLPVFDVPGKIIIDTTNPYREDGSLFDLGDDISSSAVVNHFNGGKVVKAFNTIWFKHLADNGKTSIPFEQRRVIPLAGDDEQAKVLVSQLIEQIGFGPLDTGTLREGSQIQGVDGLLYNKEYTLKDAAAMVRNINKHLV